MSSADSSKFLPCGRPKTFQHKAPSPEKIEELKARLREYLTKSHLKFTDQRWSIAQTIINTGGHLDAQQIVENVRQGDSTIGPATVYRTLKVLCDADILEKTHQEVGGRILYELPDEEHHDHIICLDCREIVEFHNDEIESEQQRLAKKLNFELKAHRHVIYAHCDYLKNKKA